MTLLRACLSGLLAAVPASPQPVSPGPADDAPVAARPASAPHRLVVATFDEHGVPAGLGDAVADMLTRAIDAPGYQLLERRQVRRVLEEQAFSASDLTQPGEAVRYGRLVDTRFVLVGTVYRIDGTYIVSARMVDSASGIVHESARAFVQFRTVDEMSSRICELAAALGLRGQGGSAAAGPADTAPIPAPAEVPVAAPGAGPTVRELLERVGDQSAEPIELAAAGPARTVRVGEELRFTVRSGRRGFLSLFVVDASGQVGMLLPNSRMGSIPVSEGQSISVPRDVGFSLRARPPLGPTRIKAIVGDAALAQTDGAGAGEALRRLELGQRIGGEAAPAAGEGWSSAELEFLVVEAGPPPVPAAVSPPAGAAPAPGPAMPGPDDVPATAPPHWPGPLPDAGAVAGIAAALTRISDGLAAPAADDRSLLLWPRSSPFESACDLRWTGARTGSGPMPGIAVIDADFDPDDPFLERSFAAMPSGDREALRSEIRRNGPASFRHGNRVASLIAGEAPWLPSVLPGVAVVPIRITTTVDAPAYRADRGGYRELLGALRAALAARCRVVNLSLSVPLAPDEVRAFAADPVWDELERAGVVVVCAAGNRREDLDAEPLYPACLERANVLCVGAVGPDGRIAEWGDRGSARGSRSVDLFAPGSSIPVSDGGGRAGLADGTSYACAFATGAVAQLIADEPSIGAAEAVSRIIAAAEPSPRVAGLSRSGLLRWPRRAR